MKIFWLATMMCERKIQTSCLPCNLVKQLPMLRAVLEHKCVYFWPLLRDPQEESDFALKCLSVFSTTLRLLNLTLSMEVQFQHCEYMRVDFFFLTKEPSFAPSFSLFFWNKVPFYLKIPSTSTGVWKGPLQIISEISLERSKKVS